VVSPFVRCGIACLGIFAGQTALAAPGVVNVLDHGAVGDGAALNTAAFQKAVAACVKQQGGTVLVPAGVYRTGPIQLQSNVTLQLEPGAVVRGSERMTDYQVGGRRRPLVWAENATNVAICGRGTIDGNGRAFMNPDKVRTHAGDFDPRLTRQGEEFMTPRFGTADGSVTPKARPYRVVALFDCRHVLMRDVTVIDAPIWTINFRDCDYVDVDGVKVLNNQSVPNDDGIHCETCRNVHISNCELVCGDDALCITSVNSRKPGVSENVTVSNCTLSSHSAGLRIGYASFNAWYWKHGWGKDYFGCSPQETSIFYDIYNDLTPGRSIAAFDPDAGRMLGACFYHPRERHVSLGIMCVHQDHWGQGVGRAMVEHILQFTRQNGYQSCRLVGSAMNMDSFSLYNRSGLVPRGVYHDMVIAVSDHHLSVRVPGEDRVRDAVLGDVAAMGGLEMELSGVTREIDYRYAIENPRKVLHAAVCENARDGIDGFIMSIRHPALNMLGPCVARSEETALALIAKELERFRGSPVLCVVPMEKRKMVEQLYAWGAVNVETHLKHVWGEFPGFRGVDMPSFLPETA